MDIGELERSLIATFDRLRGIADHIEDRIDTMRVYCNQMRVDAANARIHPDHIEHVTRILETSDCRAASVLTEAVMCFCEISGIDSGIMLPAAEFAIAKHAEIVFFMAENENLKAELQKIKP